MGRIKKAFTTEKGVGVEFSEEKQAYVAAETKSLIQPLSLDTGREETNTIVSKINEIIGHLNA